MTTLLNSIQMPSDDVFEAQYMKTLVNVGINDLFAGCSIREINSKQRFIDEFGDIEAPIDDIYDNVIGIQQVVSQLKGRGRHEQLSASTPKLDCDSMPIRDYFDYQQRHPGNPYSRILFPPSAEMAESYRIPGICRARADEEEKVHAAFLIGIQGSFSHLHFDKDGRHGLLYQVYGRKRVVVFPYESSYKLAPFTQFAFWCIQSFDDAERQRFLRYAGGRELVLEPGDAVYIPPYSWHYVDYLEDCCSINLRFRRPARLEYLAQQLFPDLYTQGIARALVDPKSGDEALHILQAGVESLSGLNGDELFGARRALARSIYHKLLPDEQRKPYCVDLEEFFPSPLQYLVDAMKRA